MKWKVEDKAVKETIEREITQFSQSPQRVIFRYTFLCKRRTVVATEEDDLPLLRSTPPALEVAGAVPSSSCSGLSIILPGS